MMRRWVAALVAAIFTVMAGPASAAIDTAAYVYDASAYVYDASTSLSSQSATTTDARGSPVGPGAVSWGRSVSATHGVVAAHTADDVAGAAPGPAFIVRPNGETVIVPQGASGPVPTRGDGFQFTGRSAGNGLHPSVSDVRIMDPVLEGKYTYPNGYASYLNSGGQTVNPFTGQTIGESSPWWHWAFE